MVILAVVVAAAATIWRAREHRSESAPPVAPEKSAKGGERLSSKEARDKLARLLDGSLKEPSGKEGIEAHSRYYKTTSTWIEALSLTDCVALIDSADEAKSPSLILEKLYRFYGELAPQAAMKRLSGEASTPPREGTLHFQLYAEVIRGWGHKEPAKAWAYYLGLGYENGGNPFLQFRDIWWEAFDVWSKEDPDEAYKAMFSAPRFEIQHASIGYYRGLPEKADFPKEAARLESLLAESKNSERMVWSTPDWPPEQALPLLLTRKWADRDPEAALAWWMKCTPPREADDDGENASYRIGKFVESWAGEWESNSPDAALRWLAGRSDLLQFGSFRSAALPALARHRPSETISLIARIESADQQSYWVSQLVGPPAFSGEGRYEHQVPSNLLKPDLVENSLAGFHFDEEQAARVREAIERRRKYDATKPPPSPSVW